MLCAFNWRRRPDVSSLSWKQLMPRKENHIMNYEYMMMIPLMLASKQKLILASCMVANILYLDFQVQLQVLTKPTLCLRRRCISTTVSMGFTWMDVNALQRPLNLISSNFYRLRWGAPYIHSRWIVFMHFWKLRKWKPRYSSWFCYLRDSFH